MKYQLSTAYAAVGYGTSSFVIIWPIYSGPLKILLPHFHPPHILALVASPEQDERRVGGEDNLVGWESIGAAAVKDFGILIIYAIWQGTAAFVSATLVIPVDPSYSETCLTP